MRLRIFQLASAQLLHQRKLEKLLSPRDKIYFSLVFWSTVLISLMWLAQSTSPHADYELLSPINTSGSLGLNWENVVTRSVLLPYYDWVIPVVFSVIAPICLYVGAFLLYHCYVSPRMASVMAFVAFSDVSGLPLHEWIVQLWSFEVAASMSGSSIVFSKTTMASTVFGVFSIYFVCRHRVGLEISDFRKGLMCATAAILLDGFNGGLVAIMLLALGITQIIGSRLGVFESLARLGGPLLVFLVALATLLFDLMSLQGAAYEPPPFNELAAFNYIFYVGIAFIVSTLSYHVFAIDFQQVRTKLFPVICAWAAECIALIFSAWVGLVYWQDFRHASVIPTLHIFYFVPLILWWSRFIYRPIFGLRLVFQWKKFWIETYSSQLLSEIFFYGAWLLIVVYNATILIESFHGNFG